MMLEAELISGWQFDVQESLLKHQNLEEIWVDSFLTAVSELKSLFRSCANSNPDKWTYGRA